LWEEFTKWFCNVSSNSDHMVIEESFEIYKSCKNLICAHQPIQQEWYWILTFTSVDTKTVASAPSSLATFSRSGEISATTTLGLPKACAASIVTRPIGPAPRISTFVGGPTPARRHACTPTLRGSHMAPSSKVTFSGSLKHKSAGCTTCCIPTLGPILKPTWRWPRRNKESSLSYGTELTVKNKHRMDHWMKEISRVKCAKLSCTKSWKHT